MALYALVDSEEDQADIQRDLALLCRFGHPCPA